jgi:hypothetical protein
LLCDDERPFWKPTMSCPSTASVAAVAGPAASAEATTAMRQPIGPLPGMTASKLVAAWRTRIIPSG